MRPLIGISSDYTSAAPSRFWLREEYAAAVWDAGGWPVILAPLEGAKVEDVANHLAGLVISGGDFDIEPSYYGESPVTGLGNISPRRTRFELELANWAMKNDLPALGICGGIQTINVAAGGSLLQDIASQLPTALSHEQKRIKLSHAVQIKPATLLADLIHRDKVRVNSTHHQAVKELAPNFRIAALATDGIIEAIESKNNQFLLGVQWHPEALYKDYPLWLKLFTGLVLAARAFIKSK